MGSPDTLSEHRTFLILMCPSIFPEKTSFHSWPPASSPIPSISGLEEDERLKTISHYWVLPGVLFYPRIPMLETMSWCLGASRRVASREVSRAWHWQAGREEALGGEEAE